MPTSYIQTAENQTQKKFLKEARGEKPIEEHG